jgi:dTDP-4-dehydrorhamnose reductase
LYFDLKNGFETLPEDVVQQTKVVFVCAAVTGFAACANDPQGSRHINVIRTVELGQHFMQRGARVVYLSSTAVFDGTQAGLTERAPTSAVTEYGKQKADCEAGLLAASAELPGSCAVVRLTKVVDRAQPIYSGWMQSFKSQAPAKAAVDLVMCPVTTAFVVSALQRIGAGNQGGVYHLSGERDMTYYELALAMAAELGVGEPVEKDWVQQRLGAVPSPAHSALSMAHTTGTWGILPQPLTEVAKELTGQE